MSLLSKSKKLKSCDLILGLLKPYLKKAAEGRPPTRKKQRELGEGFL
jgi:hypothetical protein